MVGSGAGGGVAAAVLAAAGLDVVVLEAGGYWSERDFDGAERTGFRRLYRGGGASATDDQGVGLIAGRVPRRRHGRQLHDLVPDARRRPSGVGGARLPGGRRLRREPGRRLRAPRRQHRPQPPVAAGRGAAARARGAGLARRRDAPERARLRPGRRLRLLRLRLSARREAVDAADVAGGRCRRRRADRRRREGPARARRARNRRRRRRRAPCRCAHERSSPPRVRSTRPRCCSAPA